MKPAKNPSPQRKMPTWKHPWCGLHIIASNAASIAKQVPIMVRPILESERACGPRGQT